jgi:phage portal protein BeeE
VVLQRTEVAHFRGMPDPLASFRGMSWLTPVLREVESDSAATGHKLKFFENGATPNMIVSLDPAILPEQFKTWVQLFKEKEPTGLDVYKTLYLGGGADATVVGSNLRQMDFKTVQGAGESRIAAAGGVPPVIAGFSEGLQAATYSNYSQARRRFADLTTHPDWQNFCGSMQVIIPTPVDAQLWYLDKHIPFLREDAKDRAEIFRIQMAALETGVRAGFEPETVKAAVMAESLSGLKHTGLYSVQLQPPLPDGPTPQVPQLTEGAA